MAVPVTTISNISRQVIKILYQQGDALNAAGDVSYAYTGMLEIHPGKSVTIEAIRINLGQLKNLEAKNLIKISQGVL